MNQDSLLEITNLLVQPINGGKPAVDRISLSVNKGEVLALIGESGSGKTTLALTALGHVRSGLVVRGGAVTLEGVSMIGAGRNELAGRRGRIVSYIAQSASMSFNQRLSLDQQVTEPALIHNSMPSAEAVLRAHDLYRSLSLPEPTRIGSRYPHQVSGGQLQRFMIAMGLILHPKLVVCDEPTSALDVTTQVDVLRALKKAIKDRQTAALFVSHDLAVVAQVADRIAVLRHGKLVEIGTTSEIIHNPRHSYTQQLIAACSRWPVTSLPPASAVSKTDKAYLELRNLWAGYGKLSASGLPESPIVKGVSLAIKRGQILAVIGESGSGKSTLARVIAGLHPKAKGELLVADEPLAASVEQRSVHQLRRVQMVFQSADTALNSKHTVGSIIERVLIFFGHVKPKERSARIKSLLEMVQLPAHYADRKPSQLSGGEKQRVNLARALAAEPDLLLCDEITSALDTVVAASIIKLIKNLRDQLNLAIMFISHDMATVASLADDIIVLKHGEIMEYESAAKVLLSPRNPYTKKLLSSVPELRTGWLEEAGNDSLLNS